MWRNPSAAARSWWAAHRTDLRPLLLALLFAAPLLLMPLARATPAEYLWQRVDSWPGEHEVQRLITVPGAGAPLYALGATGGLYISRDGARTWARANIPFPSSPMSPVRVMDLAANTRNPAEAYLLVARDESRPRPVVYITRDGGVTWAAESGLGPLRVRALAYGPHGRDLYMVAPGDLYRFDHPETAGLDPAKLSVAADRWHIAPLDPRDEVSAMVVGAWDGTGASPGARRFIYLPLKSGGMHVLRDDAGPQALDLPVASADTLSALVRQQARIYAISPHTDRPTTVLVSTDRGVYASIDGGATWFATAYSLRAKQVRALHIDPTDGTIYAGLAGDGVYASRDDGATWARLGYGLGATTVLALAIGRDAGGQRVLYAGTGDGLWRVALSPSPGEPTPVARP
ncbi:MAG: hypothetical protein V1772_08375 [Chloroflexota bacterium]